MRSLPFLLLLVITLLCCGSMAPQAEASEKSRGEVDEGEGKADILILWDHSTVEPPDPGLFGAFLGTVREGDRVGVAALSKDAALVLPLQTFSGGGALSGAYQMTSKLANVDNEGNLNTGIQVAVRYLDYQKRKGVTRAVVVVTEASSNAGGGGDAGPAVVRNDLLSNLLLGEVAVYALTVGNTPSPGLGTLVASSGGKGVSVTDGEDVIDGLSLVYDSLQLRAMELSRVRDEADGGPVDYRYLDELVDTPDEGVEADRKAASQMVVGQTSPLLISLVALLVVLNGAVLFFTLWRTRSSRVGNNTAEDDPGSHRVNESPSFSRLTMGLNRFRGAFKDAESRMESLGLDLEDYGAESWDMEKRLMDEYVSLAQRIFLLIDHMRVAPGSADGGHRAALERKLVRILEDSGIDEIDAESGEELDSRLHVHAGERESEMGKGIILEVARKGYIKSDGLSHGEPLVLRKAEVIVSGGPGVEAGENDGGER